VLGGVNLLWLALRLSLRGVQYVLSLRSVPKRQQFQRLQRLRADRLAEDCRTSRGINAKDRGNGNLATDILLVNLVLQIEHAAPRGKSGIGLRLETKSMDEPGIPDRGAGL
jgi:hypothetical protein